MTTAELVANVRLILDDTVVPYLITDDEILFALTNAQDEFATQTYCYYTTTETVSSVAGQPIVQLPEQVFELRALISSAGSVVRPVTTNELEYGSYALSSNSLANTHTNWRAVVGTPRFAVVDAQHGSARLVPIPDEADTFTAEGYAIPPALALDPVQDPTIPAPYHQDLAAGAVAAIYGSQHVEIADASAAQEWLARWKMALDRATHQLNAAPRVIQREYRLPGTINRRKTYRPASTNS